MYPMGINDSFTAKEVMKELCISRSYLQILQKKNIVRFKRVDGSKHIFFYKEEILNLKARMCTDNYYTQEKVLEILNLSESTWRKIKKKEKIGKINLFGKKENFFLREEIEQLKTRLGENRFENYFSLMEVWECLGIISMHIWGIIQQQEDLEPKFVEKYGTKYFAKEDIFQIKKKQEYISKNYYSSSQLKEVFNKKLSDFLNDDTFIRKVRKDKRITTISAPAIVSSLCRINSTLYSKTAVDLLINEVIEEKESISMYYTTEEAKEILNVNERYRELFNQIIKEEELKRIKIKRTFYFLKSDIHRLKIKQDDILQNYFSNQQLLEFCEREANGIITFDNLMRLMDKEKRIDTPTLVNGHVPFSMYLYKRSEVNNIIKEYQDKIIYLASFEEPYETYAHRIKFKMLSFSEEATNTGNLWDDYVRVDLKTRNRSDIDTYVNILVGITEELINFTQEKEIYNFYANDINLFFGKIPNMYGAFIYYFIVQLYDQIREKNGTKIFKLTDIINPKRMQNGKPEVNNSIYTFDEYLHIHKYVGKTEFHKKNAIDDLKLGGGSKCYASSWLYILVHLTNGWRDSDVRNFPRIDLRGTSVDCLEWLEENELSDELAIKILDRIVQSGFTGSYVVSKIKTKRVFNQFFYSKDLAKSFATAAVICELATRMFYSSSIKSKDKNDNRSKVIIHFNTKNGKFSTGSRNAFFKGFDSDIKFGSRKMNRTVLSFLNYIAINNGDGGVSLELSQFLRVHVDKETTQRYYIHLEQEQLDFLTRQLFSRDYFGYIPSLLSELLTGRSENSHSDLMELVNRSNRSMIKVEKDMRTREIKTILDRFGDIHKIQATAGFLNQLQQERKSIREKLFEMSFDEILSLTQKLYNEELPSKEEHVQCLVSPNCLKIGTNTSCLDCQYSIPNYYALSTLALSVLEILQNFSEKLKHQVYPAEKARLANIFYSRNLLLKEACKRFGKEVVFNFLGMAFEDYKDILKEIESIDHLKTIT